MSTPSNAVPESFESQRVAPVVVSATQPMCWSVKRELWENRSIYIGPLAVGAIVMLGFLISLVGLPRSVRELVGSHPRIHKPDGSADRARNAVRPRSDAHGPHRVSGGVLLLAWMRCTANGGTGSILFWKSLPVSDLTTVLSKAIIPLAVLPALTLAVTFSLCS